MLIPLMNEAMPKSYPLNPTDQVQRAVIVIGRMNQRSINPRLLGDFLPRSLIGVFIARRDSLLNHH